MHPIPTLDLETELAARGADYIFGLDEVGRGALAGPVMVGIVAVRSADLPKIQVPCGLADSKILTQRRRQAIYKKLEDWVAAWAVGSCTNHEIDRLGITQALGLASLRALTDLEGQLELGVKSHPAAILDGPFDYITPAWKLFGPSDLPILPPVTTKIRGDTACATVASAAVIAKVTRDMLMIRLTEENPDLAHYHWEHNKGYGSAQHREAIKRYGPSAFHRISWHLTG